MLWPSVAGKTRETFVVTPSLQWPHGSVYKHLNDFENATYSQRHLGPHLFTTPLRLLPAYNGSLR